MIEIDAADIRALLERQRYDEAAAACNKALESAPDNRDALYMLAVAERYRQNIPLALATLDRLERFHPRFGRLYQERGHCHVALRDAPQAITAYELAVGRNPALTASWDKLQTLYRMTGREDDCAIAAARLRAASSLAPEVRTASALFADGDLQEAETLIRSYLQKPENGRDIEGMRLLARIALEMGITDDAEILLGAVLDIEPAYHLARYDYATALLGRHKYAAAIEQLERLLAHDPENRTYRTTHATACVGIGEHEKALQLYRGLLEDAPGNPELHLSIAHTLKTLGHYGAAVESYRKATGLRPDYGDAYWSLANLKTYRFEDAELERMLAGEASPETSSEDRYHLSFALGKAFEDRGDYEESFRHYERGNRLKRDSLGYRPEQTESKAQEQISLCGRAFFEQRAGYGDDDDSPIFIVGLPRSGSTLLEQILASHSAVEGTMELAEIAATAHDLGDYPAGLATLTAEDCRRLGRKYIQDTRVYRTGKRFFIDKMPNNFRHIGLIHLILPRAKIIDARRDPMACCFSNFKQLFASGQEFTYGLEEIGRYYRAYVDLMAHWDSVLPGKILRVGHEDVVDDLDANVRRLLDFCGLPYEEACRTFWKTDRAVRTASSEQVRKPIFRDSLDQWRNFAPWLDPLRDALGSLAIRD